MRRTLTAIYCLVVMGAVFAGGSYAQTAKGAAGRKFAAEVPLLDCDGTPCVEGRIGEGKVLKFGIDTGNVDSVLESGIAEAAGLKPTAALPEGAPKGMFRTVIASVSVGTVKLTGVPALSVGLAEMISQNQMPHVDGTLAYTAFKNRMLQLDFAAHKVRISEELTAPATCTGTCDKISLVRFGNDGPPIVVAEGFAINGKKVTAQVDTMYTGSLLVYTASIEKLGLVDTAKTTKTRDFPLTDGGVKMNEAAAKKESFHEVALGGLLPTVYFPTADVHEPDGLFDATVGLELFYNAVVTLNFRDLTISIEKP
jgi:hypothetical protein